MFSAFIHLSPHPGAKRIPYRFSWAKIWRKVTAVNRSPKWKCVDCIKVTERQWNLTRFCPESKQVSACITCGQLYVFLWVIPLSLNFICRRFGTSCTIFVTTRLWRWYRMLRNVGIYNIQSPGELPRRKHTASRTRRKCYRMLRNVGIYNIQSPGELPRRKHTASRTRRKWYRMLRNVGIYNIQSPGDLPRRKHTSFRTRQKWYRMLRNVGIYNIQSPGELPRRKHTAFRTRRNWYRMLRNVGIYNIQSPGELPRRKHTASRTRRKFWNQECGLLVGRSRNLWGLKMNSTLDVS